MLIILLLTFAASALAGSPCPPRENIYPCSCLSLPQGKNIFFTSITCHRLPTTDAFSSILPTLRTLAIDHFYLYDSFWEARNLGAEAENKQILPADWLTLLKIKEIEIVDTTLSASFACHPNQNYYSCRNDITTRFTAVNSSSHDKISTICDNGKGSKFSWTSCMNRLQQFQFRHGRLTSIKTDLFPLRMTRLTELDLSYNSISSIAKGALQNLPKLKTLDLSHNLLDSISGIAGTQLADLQEIDLSWNLLKSLSLSFFSVFPKLKAVMVHNNALAELKENEWKGPPKTLRTIDLKDNPVHCNCNIRWINNTFPVHVNILGHCISPDDFENSAIRTASRMLNERCDEDGNIGTRKRTAKAAPTEPMFVTY